MFTKPLNGWANLTLGKIKPRASYLTDIPNDMLEALINFYNTNSPQTVFFDAEGYEWYLILGYNGCYILSDKVELTEPSTYTWEEEVKSEYICECVDELTDIFIENLIEYEKEWDLWNYDPSNDYKIKLEELKKIIKWEE
ncbi:MAG: hypothetical protein WCO84_01185 [bacterium]